MTQIELSRGASMAEYQQYIHELEELHGWLQVDLVRNCFLMGEEVGELFKAVRKVERMFDQPETADQTLDDRKTEVAHELVDVFNYLCAIANRLDIDLEQAFRDKNQINQGRTWNS